MATVNIGRRSWKWRKVKMNRLPFGFSHSVWAWGVLAFLAAALLIPAWGGAERLLVSSGQLSAARADLDRLDTALNEQFQRNARIAGVANISQSEWSGARTPEQGAALIEAALNELETALVARSARIARLETPIAETLDRRTLALTSEVVFVLPVEDALEVLAAWDAGSLRVEAFSLIVLAGQELQVRARVSYVMLREAQEG